MSFGSPPRFQQNDLLYNLMPGAEAYSVPEGYNPYLAAAGFSPTHITVSPYSPPQNTFFNAYSYAASPLLMGTSLSLSLSLLCA